MEENAIRAMTKDLMEVIAGARATDFQDKAESLERTFSRRGTAFQLVDRHAFLLESIVRSLLKFYGEKFTEKYVEGKICDIIADCLREPDKEVDLELTLKGIISDLEAYNQEWIVVYPIDGLTMNQIETLDIGPISLFVMEGNKYEELLVSFERVISTLKNPEDQREYFKESIRKTFAEYKGMVCAQYKVVADSDRAKERAEHQTQLVLDILSLTIPIFHPERHKVRIGLLGEVISKARAIPLISSEFDHTCLKRERIGPLTALELNPERVAKLIEWNILSLAEALSNDKVLNDFQSTLFRSIRWFSHAISQDDIEIKFLCFVVVLETLLVPRDNSPISNAIAEGAALVLADKLDDRKEIKALVKRLYALRSALAHGARKAILDTDLKNICSIALDLILKLAAKTEYETHKSFLEWIEDQRLG